MERPAEIDPEYLRLLLLYYEEEIMGEAYFESLAEIDRNADERRKLVLLSKVERCASETILPLLCDYGLRPRDEAELRSLGKADAERHLHLSWAELVDHIVTTYPRFVDDFQALERMAPDADLPALKRLTHHETVTIDFANKERTGDRDSDEPLRAYLDDRAA